MPGRDPEARQRSEKVAAEIRTVMREQGLTGAGLRDLLEKAGHTVSNDMWISRRTTGEVNLVQPVTTIYGPTADLVNIAKVLGVDADRFVRVVNPGLGTVQPTPKARKSRKSASGDQPADATAAK